MLFRSFPSATFEIVFFRPTSLQTLQYVDEVMLVYGATVKICTVPDNAQQLLPLYYSALVSEGPNSTHIDTCSEQHAAIPGTTWHNCISEDVRAQGGDHACGSGFLTGPPLESTNHVIRCRQVSIHRGTGSSWGITEDGVDAYHTETEGPLGVPSR